MSYIFIIFLFLSPFCVFSQNVAMFSSGNGSVTNGSLDEVKKAYQVVLNSTLNAPTRAQFVRDYVRYRVIVEEAYNDRSLVKSARIRNSVVDLQLRQTLDQSVYKVFISRRMQAQLSRIDREVRNVSNRELQKFYRSNPYFNIHFIVLDIPQSANKSQISEIRKNFPRRKLNSELTMTLPLQKRTIYVGMSISFTEFLSISYSGTFY